MRWDSRCSGGRCKTGCRYCNRGASKAGVQIAADREVVAGSNTASSTGKCRRAIMPAGPVKRLFRVEAGKCHRYSPLGSGVSGRIGRQKGQRVGCALPQLCRRNAAEQMRGRERVALTTRPTSPARCLALFVTGTIGYANRLHGPHVRLPSQLAMSSPWSTQVPYGKRGWLNHRSPSSVRQEQVRTSMRRSNRKE